MIKAYAKRYKKFEEIITGNPAFALTDLTGGISITCPCTSNVKFDWNSPGVSQMFDFVYENQQQFIWCSLISGGGGGTGSETDLGNGLCGGHVYTLIKAEMVKDIYGNTQCLVQIR